MSNEIPLRKRNAATTPNTEGPSVLYYEAQLGLAAAGSGNGNRDQQTMSLWAGNDVPHYQDSGNDDSKCTPTRKSHGTTASRTDGVPVQPQPSWCNGGKTSQYFHQHQDCGDFHPQQQSWRFGHGVSTRGGSSRNDEQSIQCTSYRSTASSSRSLYPVSKTRTLSTYGSDRKPSYRGQQHSIRLESYSCCPKPPPIDVEISPGVIEPLRGSIETWAAVRGGFVCFPECCCCGSHLVCIIDALYVLCPNCKVVHPLHSSSDRQMGVGLGLLASDVDGSA